MGSPDYLTVLHDADAIGKIEHVVDVVADQENTNAVGLELLDEIANLGGLLRTEGRRGFVHDQDAGIEQNGAGDSDRLALPTREGSDQLADRSHGGHRETGQRLTGRPFHVVLGWRQVLQLYDQLLAIAPNAIVALNRAVAVAELEGAAPALAVVDRLDLDTYYLFHATRGELLARLERYEDAARAYARALELTSNEAERALLERKRASFPV